MSPRPLESPLPVVEVVFRNFAIAFNSLVFLDLRSGHSSEVEIAGPCGIDVGGYMGSSFDIVLGLESHDGVRRPWPPFSALSSLLNEDCLKDSLHLSLSSSFSDTCLSFVTLQDLDSAMPGCHFCVLRCPRFRLQSAAHVLPASLVLWADVESALKGLPPSWWLIWGCPRLPFLDIVVRPCGLAVCSERTIIRLECVCLVHERKFRHAFSIYMGTDVSSVLDIILSFE